MKRPPGRPPAEPRMWLRFGDFQHQIIQRLIGFGTFPELCANARSSCRTEQKLKDTTCRALLSELTDILGRIFPKFGQKVRVVD